MRLPVDELGGDADGGVEARRISLALPRDVERRAVVHGRANDGQAEREIHTGVEGQHLERDVPLVVVETDERIEVLAHARRECRIRHQRAGRVNAAPPGFRHGWRDELLFLALAEQAVFPGVRIQAANADARQCGQASSPSPRR